MNLNELDLEKQEFFSTVHKSKKSVRDSMLPTKYSPAGHDSHDHHRADRVFILYAVQAFMNPKPLLAKGMNERPERLPYHGSQ
jgi:hypothetical protein